MIRVIITDDHPILRRGLKDILEEEADIEVVDEASSGQELLQKISREACDVVLLDINMPGRDGLDTLSELHRLHPKLAVLIVSVYPEDQFGSRVLKSGAAGYMNKESACDDLIVAVRKICTGGKYISPRLAEKLASDLAADNSDLPPHEKLSDREYQVMRMIASGKMVGEIARELCLSEKTISTHRARILEKMEMKTNAQLTYYAIHKELVTPG